MKQHRIERQPLPHEQLAAVENPIVMGRIGQAYGIKGWVKIQSFSDPTENIANYQPWYLAHPNGYQAINILQFKAHGKGYVAQIEGCDDRTQAQQYTNLDIVVDKQQLPKLADDDYYLFELEGMDVLNLDDVKLGTVSQILPTGANDVLVIEGEKQHLVPMVDDLYLKNVDKKQQRITVDWDPEF